MNFSFSQGIQTELRELSEQLSMTTNFSMAWNMFEAFLKKHGGKSAIYAFFPKNIGRALSREVVTMSSHPEEFNHLYVEKGYIDHDPYAQFCMLEDRGALIWGDERASQYTSERTHIVQNMMVEFGVEHGVTIPVRDWSGSRIGGIGLALDTNDAVEAKKTLSALMPVFEQALMLFHARVQESDLMRQVFSLTHREEECLVWAAAGMTNHEIAYKLSISDKTVEMHLANASRKLNARNRTHAVARALIYNVIRP